MLNKPLISVVIPAYNEEKYLPACLAAIRKQTFKDFELIVVDNNSTDKTAEIARKYGARVVHETTQGIIPTRERGFAEAKAEIIARTDADTTVPLDWLEIIFREFRQDPSLVGITGIYITNSTIFNLWNFVLVKILSNLIMGHELLIGSSMAIKKSAWEKISVNKNELLYLEDWDLSCHLFEIGKIKRVHQLNIPFADRWFKTPKGLFNYLTSYPFRYLITVWTHHPFFKRHQYPN